MNQTITHIRENLSGIYDKEEIESFISLIFHKLCGYSRAEIIISKNNNLSQPLKEEIFSIVERLKTHEPIQYILGECEFYGSRFITRKGALIPRPETEELVDLIIHSEAPGKMIEILDIGTGSGCIAISLSKNIPSAHLYAWDISEQALSLAKENATINNADVCFEIHDILDNARLEHNNRFDVIVSNPPYICQSEKSLMQANVLDFEPHLALFVDDCDPLLFYRSIAEFATRALRPDGHLYFEINERFGKQTQELLEQMGYSDVEIINDISGKQRMTKACLKK